MTGNQHGVSFSREVGMEDDGGDKDIDGSDTAVILEGSQVCPHWLLRLYV